MRREIALGQFQITGKGAVQRHAKRPDSLVVVQHDTTEARQVRPDIYPAKRLSGLNARVVQRQIKPDIEGLFAVDLIRAIIKRLGPQCGPAAIMRVLEDRKLGFVFVR